MKTHSLQPADFGCAFSSLSSIALLTCCRPCCLCSAAVSPHSPLAPPYLPMLLLTLATLPVCVAVLCLLRVPLCHSDCRPVTAWQWGSEATARTVGSSRRIRCGWVRLTAAWHALYVIPLIELRGQCACVCAGAPDGGQGRAVGGIEPRRAGATAVRGWIPAGHAQETALC